MAGHKVLVTLSDREFTKLQELKVQYSSAITKYSLAGILRLLLQNHLVDIGTFKCINLNSDILQAGKCPSCGLQVDNSLLPILTRRPDGSVSCRACKNVVSRWNDGEDKS